MKTMTWHETIQYIRSNPEYKELVEKAYFEEDLSLNIERFCKSEEFSETLKLLKIHAPHALSILDIGSGNGISTISFALKNYNVTAIEPDSSDTIGAGAIKKLKDHYCLNNIEIKESFAEDLNFEKEQFDIVYARQSMHHANDLDKFIEKAVQGLKKGGLFISVRDHVIYNQDDKEWFLEHHPLQKFYGGENAFSEIEYINAIKNAGLSLKKTIRHYYSVINYFPMTKNRFFFRFSLAFIFKQIYKIPFFKKIKFIKSMANMCDERKIPGRVYSFIAIKI
jgi:ubiquinone/menaquinone biosynthesis C-methylase UbiE